MLITITNNHGKTFAVRAPDIAAVTQHSPADHARVHLEKGHPLQGSWAVRALHIPGLCTLRNPTLEQVTDAINTTTTEEG